MSQTQFTEGSWRVSWGKDKEGDPYFDILKNDGDADDDGRMIDASYSIVEMAYPVIDEEEAKANANLIGASPDLYQALQELLLAIEAQPVKTDGRLARCQRNAAMALAYARGEDYRVGEDDL